MPKADTQQVAKLLREYAQRTALRGGNPYRAKAYSRAADSLAALAQPLDDLIEENRLTEIPGVGDAIADIITKLHRNGTHPSLEKLRKEIPVGVLELLSVPGLRPDKALRLYKDLGITSLTELEAAAKDDRIRKAKGLGAALQTKILQNLAIARSGVGRLHLHRAAALLEHAMKSLRSARPDLKRLTIAGDFRRGCELVGNFSIVVEAPTSGEAPPTANAGGLQVYLTDRRRFGVALLFATGSAAHLNELQALAADKRMQLDPDGLHKGRRVIAAKEEDIYRALGLPFIEPELREGRGEIERALKGELPRLVTDKDLRGILHCHTDASDGTETLETMAKATRQRGFEYFVVADHSKSAHYAGGLSVERIEEQHREVDRVNREFGKDFRILKGIESDILADGSLDYSDDVLARFGRSPGPHDSGCYSHAGFGARRDRRGCGGRSRTSFQQAAAVLHRVEEHGVEGDAHAGAFVRHRYLARRRPRFPNLRQLHVIPRELFDTVRALGYDVFPGELGENITTAGLELERLPVGTIIRLGATAAIELTGLRTPCVLIDRFRKGLRKEMIGRGGEPAFRCGVMGIVTVAGEVIPGAMVHAVLPPRPWFPPPAL